MPPNAPTDVAAPRRGERFTFGPITADPTTGELTFAYDLDGTVLREVMVLPAEVRFAPSTTADVLLDICQVAIGTSYFKASAARTIAADRPLHAAAAGLIGPLYDHGLREFAFENDLGIPLATAIEVAVEGPPVEVHPGPSASAPARPLLPIGGGKDSAAVLGLLPDATAITISPTPAHRHLVAAAGRPLLEVGRRLDPNLAAATAGGFNGHIPITAINSAVSALVAHLGGFDAVVMGNERSTNEPTRMVGAEAVNHQYSKSFDFEVALGDALRSCGVDYWSILRQLTGLGVAGLVVADGRLLGDFLSCNRAFRKDRGEDDPQPWCLECAKCHYTFLCFSRFLDLDQAAATFGGNPLAVAANASSFGSLWRVDDKPFDCVGERQESAHAFALLADRDGWRDLPVVVALADEAQKVAAELDADDADLLAAYGPHRIPEPIRAAVADAVAALGPRP